MKAILTFDVGTTAVKTCLFDDGLRPLAVSAGEYALCRPEQGKVELDPEIYWREMRRGLMVVLEKSGIARGDVAVITVTTQGETLIPVDGEGNPLCHAIVWLDERAGEEACFLRKAIAAEEFFCTTGLPEVGPAVPLAKLLWLKGNMPGLFARTHKFLLLEDFLLHRLTGKYVTNPSLMSSTGYYDIRNNTIWDEASRLAGVGRGKFCDVVGCGLVAGALSPDAAAELGLPAGIPVSTGAMDQVASAIGAGNIVPGIVTETTGTALVAAATVRSPGAPRESGITVYRHFNDSYLLLSYFPMAGIVLKWFRDEFCRDICRQGGETAYATLDELAAGVPAGAAGLTLLPYFSGGAPGMDAGARGAFFGINLNMGRAHFVRAILEGVGCMLRDCIGQLEGAGVEVGEIRSLGGGAASALWCAIKAGVTGKRLVTMAQRESTSLGAAMLGAVSIGLYGSVEEACNKAATADDAFLPDGLDAAAYDNLYKRYRMLCSRLYQ